MPRPGDPSTEVAVDYWIIQSFNAISFGALLFLLASGLSLMTNPTTLLMDEPTEGLAPIVVQSIRDTILHLRNEGLSILLVEQNVPFALKVTDHVHILSKGRIVSSLSPEELWSREDIKSQYLGL
jgi:branched-chain amino acid transport system ATP-binding protein